MPKRSPKRNGQIVLKPETLGYFGRIAGVLKTKGKVLKAFLVEKKEEQEL